MKKQLRFLAGVFDPGRKRLASTVHIWNLAQENAPAGPSKQVRGRIVTASLAGFNNPFEPPDEAGKLWD